MLNGEFFFYSYVLALVEKLKNKYSPNAANNTFTKIKMELLCILISLALVNNLVAALDEYHKQVIMTNQHIQRAGVRLPEIIRNIVRRPSSMKKMAFMLAVPESENANIEEKLLYQSCMQTEIIAATGIDVPVLPETAEGDFENFDLSDFGRTRRNMTSAAVKALIRSQIRGDTNFSVNFTEYHLCSLIGLFKKILVDTDPLMAVFGKLTLTLLHFSHFLFKYNFKDNLFYSTTIIIAIYIYINYFYIPSSIQIVNK
ncbi:uncharacterized protein LOC126840087 isoform X2 [Adelges cooleyi]|uniref:uncharacterized protein LOC126840087 isoform X2 n=1 Tax=Adelges cooleyi TaxID=133065 RepID=UPI00217FF499|nr:uncharacterized protein LOC126840087 isoform X2 [Adelges cooleyi]